MRPVAQLHCPGGTVAAGALETFARNCVGAGIEQVFVSPRQSLLALGHGAGHNSAYATLLRGCAPVASANVMSSAWERPAPETWLRESALLSILDELALLGGADVSLVDRLSARTPHTGARFNCVTATVPHHWRFVARLRNGSLCEASCFVSTFALPGALETLVALDAQNPLWSEEDFQMAILPFASPVSRRAEGRSAVPESEVDEGFSEEADGMLRLTIAAESRRFEPAFLDEVGFLARRYRLGRVFLTPDHRIVLRNLPVASREEWLDLLRGRRLRLRHDAYDLGWRVDFRDNARCTSIQRELRRRHVGLEGLRFAFGTEPTADGAHVWLERTGLSRIIVRLGVGSGWKDLGGAWSTPGVAALVARAVAEPGLPIEVPEPTEPAQAKGGPVLTCPHCLTVYDPLYGDEHAGIAAGTLPEELPEHYECAVCGAPRGELVA